MFRTLIYLSCLFFVLPLSLGATQAGCTLDPTQAWLALYGYTDAPQDIYVSDGICTLQIAPARLVLGGEGSHPNPLAWSTDRRLAWESEHEADGEIYVWDGTNVVNVSQNPDGYDLQPTWSADGRLAMQSYYDEQWHMQVWDGTDVTNVSGAAGSAKMPFWSTDGRLAWFGSTEDGSGIVVWNGLNTTFIDANLWTYSSLVWSLDGRLAWIADENGNQECLGWCRCL